MSKNRIPNREMVYGYPTHTEEIVQRALEAGYPEESGSANLLFKGVDLIRMELPRNSRPLVIQFKGRLFKCFSLMSTRDLDCLPLREVTEEDIEKLRIAVRVPEGTMPRWYDRYA